MSTPIRPTFRPVVHDGSAPADLGPELPVAEVASRLGLPVGMLVRRIEAGDVPARRVEGPDGPEYHLRIGDLGIDPAAVPGGSADEELVGTAAPRSPGDSSDAAAQSGPPSGPPAATGPPSAAGADAGGQVVDFPGVEVLDVPPPPGAATPPQLTLLDYPASGPRAEIGTLHLDPRELVAGLLDRWERTLEQRIYAEQRQRFEAELTARQAQVRQLETEVERLRAEHAAAQALKDSELARRDLTLAEKERALADRERELHDARGRPLRRRWPFAR